MNTVLFFVLFFIVASSFMAVSADAHSDKHVQKLCGRLAYKNVMNLCPQNMAKTGQLCINGELPSITEYCSMGFSDSQIKFMCCPTQDLQTE